MYKIRAAWESLQNTLHKSWPRSRKGIFRTHPNYL